ncbi:MAG: hypothetical protein ACKVXR_01510 [Planctomycetota bacterium]
MLSALARDITSTVVRASWFAIGLGLVFEGLQVAAVSLGGGELPAFAAVLADSMQKVSWSYLVCVSLAIGTSATRASPGVVGVLGLLAAPLAFVVARVAHKTAGQVLSIVVPSGGPSPWLLAAIKAAEYFVLGWLITRLVRRREPRLAAFAATGLAIGVVFGGAMLMLMNNAAPDGLPTPILLARGVNEILFPVGCSCLLWVTGVLAARAR